MRFEEPGEAGEGDRDKDIRVFSIERARSRAPLLSRSFSFPFDPKVDDTLVSFVPELTVLPTRRPVGVIVFAPLLVLLLVDACEAVDLNDVVEFVDVVLRVEILRSRSPAGAEVEGEVIVAAESLLPFCFTSS